MKSTELILFTNEDAGLGGSFRHIKNIDLTV